METKTYIPSLYLKQRYQINKLKQFDAKDQIRIEKITKAYVDAIEKYQQLKDAIKEVCTYGGNQNGND